MLFLVPKASFVDSCGLANYRLNYLGLLFDNSINYHRAPVRPNVGVYVDNLWVILACLCSRAHWSVISFLSTFTLHDVAFILFALHWPLSDLIYFSTVIWPDLSLSSNQALVHFVQCTHQSVCCGVMQSLIVLISIVTKKTLTSHNISVVS